MLKNKLFGLAIITALLFNLIAIVIYTSSEQTTQEHKPITGYATQTNGNVNITILNTLSIAADDRVINFTGCNTNATIYSNVSDGNANADCEGYIADSIIIRNDGTILANVTVQFTNWGEAHNGTFLDSPNNSSWLAYSVKNDSQIVNYDGGCLRGMQAQWFNVTNNNETRVCDFLDYDAEDNSFSMDFAIHIPADVGAGQNSFTISFWANIP